jgi:hypothetical protein
LFVTGPDPLEADPLEAALDRYARAFLKAGLPFLRGAAGSEARRVAVELLDRAVAKGRPLDHWAVMRALGHRRPPEGACW